MMARRKQCEADPFGSIVSARFVRDAEKTAYEK